jgi:preprotein translocase subunit SecY
MITLFSDKTNRYILTKKIIITFLVILFYLFGNRIPIHNIDQDALKKTLVELGNNNPILQSLAMYTSGNNIGITPLSLGIVPYINASIIMDLLTALIPSLEKLQSEEGENGRKTLTFYKKCLTILLGSFQTFVIIGYLKNFIYNNDIFELSLIGLQLVTGSLIVIWITSIIDKRGIGNGTSIIILINILLSLIGHFPSFFESFFSEKSETALNQIKYASMGIYLNTDILIIFLLIGLICISQSTKLNIPVVSARQLVYLEEMKMISLEEYLLITQNGLLIKLNQAGIFPIIIASNLLPFFSYFTSNFITTKDWIGKLFYYCLIIIFNYFYTTIFWDPEKIADRLRKSSVSIINIRPGQETIDYLQKKVFETSTLGGLLLCLILAFYDSLKEVFYTNSDLLNQINITSLIISVGVGYEIQKTIQSLTATTITEIICDS